MSIKTCGMFQCKFEVHRVNFVPCVNTDFRFRSTNFLSVTELPLKLGPDVPDVNHVGAEQMLV